MVIHPLWILQSFCLFFCLYPQAFLHGRHLRNTPRIEFITVSHVLHIVQFWESVLIPHILYEVSLVSVEQCSV